MQSVIEIEHLSREEKLQVMEALWESLSSDDEIASPDWHKDELFETGRRLESGQEQIIDWRDAKKELRKRFE